MQGVSHDAVRTPVRDLHAHAMPCGVSAHWREQRCNFRSLARHARSARDVGTNGSHELALLGDVSFGVSGYDLGVLRGQPSSR
jgi:hypothetical protein